MHDILVPFEMALDIFSLKYKEYSLFYYALYHPTLKQGELFIPNAPTKNKFTLGKVEKVAAPSIEQIINWLIDEHKIHVTVEVDSYGGLTAKVSFYRESSDDRRKVLIQALTAALKMVSK